MKVAVINPLDSRAPTGMAVAGAAVAEICRALGVDSTPDWVSRLFCFINDRVPGPVRMIVRLLAVQVVPLILGRRFLVFTAHQAPLWRTGRHAVIVHDLISVAFPFQHRLQSIFFLGLLPRVLQAAEYLVTISEATKGALYQHLPLERIKSATVIPSYSARVGGSHGTQEPRLLRRFLFVGAKYRHKNLDLVLKAFQSLRARGFKDLELVVLGCDRTLWQFPQESEKWLTWIPYADDETLRQEYAQCTALIYPSLAEGLGLPPLEAMSAGCPVICSDIPALRETCGNAAWYVDPRDPESLTALLEDGLRGGQAKAAAGKRAATEGVLVRFSRERISEQWRTFFQKCASA